MQLALEEVVSSCVSLSFLCVISPRPLDETDIVVLPLAGEGRLPQHISPDTILAELRRTVHMFGKAV